ncbi:MAG: malate/lactate/ureidoglycolate dehydrogenase [Rhodospirillales bacterium]|nr:malate/lactate/ureidoglycolate dehydrogenase [Rhodospirillales bacterium]MBO6785782.1 malate/lactate/ureidoglycolate dehydrogenase [Rhodospirillales bacterium]
MTSDQPTRVSADGMTRLGADIFERAGASAGEAHAISANLVNSNLNGHDSHGVVRIPRYLMWEKTGNLAFGQSATVVADADNFALIDGNRGFGQVVGAEAVDIGIAKAKANGVSILALRNAGHLGRIGFWAERACDAGLVSVSFVNVAHSMLVAPFGAADRRVSTAPVTIGVVNPDGDDFILDFATSMVAEGKVMVALRGGKPVPEGALIDGNGQPTTDPVALYGEPVAGKVADPREGPGALTTFGEHKGSGLALACELLAGALTGSGTTGPGKKTHNGMFSVFLKPELLDDGHGFAGAVSEYINFVRNARPRDADQPVMIPGDPERRARADRTANGFDIPAGAWNSILDAGEGLGYTRDEMIATATRHIA